MMKSGFDIDPYLKALPGTTSLVLRLRSLKSSLPGSRRARSRAGPSHQQDVHIPVGGSWLFSQERHNQDRQPLGNSSFKGRKGRGGNSSQKRNQDGRGHRQPNSYSRYYLFALLIWKGSVSFGQNKKIKVS